MDEFHASGLAMPTRRRNALKLLSSAPLLWAPPYTRAQSDSGEKERLLWEGRQSIPADFLGQHFHAPLATPSYHVNLWRSHDGPSMQWRDAHMAADRFDWRSHDIGIEHYFKLGLPCNYCLYGTPAWASSKPWLPDPYHNLGGNSAPSSTASAEAFVRALLTRYRGRIRYLEIWNEFNNTAGAVFWRDSVDDLARLARTVYQTAKAVDPSVVVLAPSVTSDDESLTRYLRASDGSGGSARQWLDAVAVHPYRAFGWSDPRHGRDLELGSWVTELRRRMTAGGLDASVPIYVTEIGYHWAHQDRSITGTSPEAFANWIDQVVLRAATLGLRQIILYSHGSALIGNPAAASNQVVAEAIDRLGRRLSGTTLERVSLTASGAYRAKTSSGELLLSGRG